MFDLISSASHAEAHRLRRILDSPNIILGDHISIPTVNQFLKLPSPSSNSYAHEMLSICLDNQISRVYPLNLSEIRELSYSRLLFEEYEIQLLIPQPEYLNSALNLCRFNSSKLVVMRNGSTISGELPPTELPQSCSDGVFEWEIQQHKLEFKLFAISDASV